MELRGTRRFAAAPQVVWNALHDGALLQSCIPGAQQVIWNGDSSVRVELVVGIGPFKGEGGITAQAVEQAAPTHLKLTFERPGPRTPMSGTLLLDLSADGTGTVLSYAANATIGGPAAALDNPVARPLIDGQLNHFFSCLDQRIR